MLQHAFGGKKKFRYEETNVVPRLMFLLVFWHQIPRDMFTIYLISQLLWFKNPIETLPTKF